jgi:ABC-2 type transport system ATP-binding protein
MQPVEIIRTENLSKHFKVLNRREGLWGAVRDLTSADYRLIKAVDGVSFTIEEGEIVGYIGPNGAGKSTTIKMMTGILKPTDGTILVNGRVPYKNRQKNAQHIGVIFGQRTQLWWDLPVIESFKLLKEIYRVDERTYRHQMGRFNELADLEALYSQPVRNLSLGQRMLADITAAFLHNPRVVFLDEPTIGLDVSIKAKIRELIKELNREHKTTIILTTHDIGDVEALCNRIIIDKGNVIYDGDIQRVNALFGQYRTLKAQVRPFRGEETVKLVHEGLSANFTTNGDNISVRTVDPGWVNITVDQSEVPLMEVLNFALHTFDIKDVQIVEISMESVIRRVYGGALES